MNIFKKLVSIQHLHWEISKHIFVQKSREIDKTTSSKQTSFFYKRKEIKTLVTFRTLFAYVSPKSIRTHGCSEINYIVFYYSEQFVANGTPIFPTSAVL